MVVRFQTEKMLSGQCKALRAYEFFIDIESNYRVWLASTARTLLRVHIFVAFPVFTSTLRPTVIYGLQNETASESSLVLTIPEMMTLISPACTDAMRGKRELDSCDALLSIVHSDCSL